MCRVSVSRTCLGRPRYEQALGSSDIAPFTMTLPSRSMVSPSPSTALQPALLHVRGHVGARVRSPRNAHQTSDRIDRVRHTRCEHLSNRRLRVVMTSGGTLSAYASRESPPKWIWRVFCCVPVRVACRRGLVSRNEGKRSEIVLAGSRAPATRPRTSRPRSTRFSRH